MSEAAAQRGNDNIRERLKVPTEFDMTQDRVFTFKNWKYRTIQSSPTACVNSFLTSNKEKVDVIQYNYSKNYCYGITDDENVARDSQPQTGWASLDLRPGYIRHGTYIMSPAHQNLIDMQEQIEKDTPATDHCHDVVAGGAQSNPEEFGPCSCYLKAAAAIQDTAMLWSEYFFDKAAYKNYSDEKAEWDQAKRDERERLKTIRSYAKTGACGTQQNCNKKSPQSDWENTGHRRGKGWGCQSECRYSIKGINKRLETWENNHRPPKKVDNPGSGPSDIPSSIFQCCTNIIQDVTIDDTSEILQNCSQKISLNEEEREEQNQLDNDLQETLVNTRQNVRDLDDTKDTKDTKDPKSNTTIIIAIVVSIVFIFLLGALVWYFSRKTT